MSRPNYGEKRVIPIGVSNHHIHLSSHDRDILFGKDYKLTYRKSLSQKGQFVTGETVTLVGNKESIEGVRVLGPERSVTQVEVSVTDRYRLGVYAPVRDSGDIEGTLGIIVIGPKGLLQLSNGVICAKRHIHMSPDEAESFGVKDKEEVWVHTKTEREAVFGNVLIRIHPSFTLELHLDTDEANAACLQNGDTVEIISLRTW